MNILSLIAFANALIGSFLSVNILRLGYKSIQNILFFLTTLGVVIWSFSYVFIYPNENVESIWIWYRISSIAWCTVLGFLLHFTLYLTGRKNLTSNKLLIVLIYIPSVAFIIRSWTGVLVAEQFIPNPSFGALEIHAKDSFWYISYLTYALSYSLLTIFLVYRWKKTTNNKIYQKQARVIIRFFTVTLVLSSASNIIPYQFNDSAPAMGALFPIIFGIGIWIAITKYQLLALSPEIAARDIISKMFDVMALTDIDGRIMKINHQIENLAGYTPEEISGKFIWNYINYDKNKSDLLSKEYHGSGHIELNTSFRTKQGNNTPVKLLSSVVYNNSGDPIGNVVVIHDLKPTLNLEEKNIELVNSHKIIKEQLDTMNELYNKIHTSELTIRKLSDNLPGGVIFQLVQDNNNNFKYTYVSEKLSDNLLVDYYKLLQNPRYILKRFHPDDAKNFMDVQQEAYIKKESLDVDVRILLPDNKYNWFKLTASPRFDNESVIWDGFLIDIDKQKKHEEEIKYINIILEGKVRERTLELEQAKDQISEALKKEQQLSKMKTDFILTISHEYRTPMTAILSSTELISMLLKNNMLEEAENYLGIIKSSIHKMTELLEKVITVESSTTGTLKLNPSKFNILNSVEDVIKQQEFIDQGKHNIRLKSELEDNSFFTDPILFRHIIENLISNAIKYSDEDSDIYIDLYEDIRSVKIRVKDHGYGFEDDDLQNIFTPFFKSEKTIGLKSGTGLGLSIVKSCVDTMNGQIDVKSKAGKGTEFIINLPKRSS